MGILNVTPDSFSDGGRFRDAGAAMARAEELAREGADLIDVGGESTRPGAEPVPTDEEAARILPVIRALKTSLPLPVSVDTAKPEVARAALEEGADIVNDVTALRDPSMRAVVAESGAGVVLMHMRGTPRTMQDNPRYADVVEEVTGELEQAALAARSAGIAAERIAVDPGIGFGKNLTHNLLLIAGLERLGRLGYPVLLGPSRKAFIGRILGGLPPEERGAGTAAACVAGLQQGARIFRVHDVRTVRHAVDVAEAIRQTALTGY